MDELAVESLRAVMAAARDCAMEMSQNLSFIQTELPNVEMPDELRARTEEVCSELLGTQQDVISELSELDELLGTPGSESDARSRVKRIVTWMGLDMVQVHELVSALHSASREDPAFAVAFVMVAESGANILNAFNTTAEAAGKIGDRKTVQ